MNDIQQHAAKVAASLDQIGGLVSDLHLPAGSPERHVFGWTLVRLSFDHARSITSLFLNHGAELAGSAFALARVMDEAFIRGAWFALHATDDDAGYFRRKDEMPSKKLTEEIEQHPPFDERKPFTQLRTNAWTRFNGYTHSGIQAVGAYMNGNTLGPNFSDADTHLLLEHAEAMAINGVIVLVTTLETADPSQLRAQHDRLNALLNIPAWQQPT